MEDEADRAVVEPAPRPSLLAVLATLEPIEENFPAVEELSLTPVDL